MSKKKPYYPIQDNLRRYLKKYGRAVKLPVLYDDLLNNTDSFPVFDDSGHDTLWESMFYSPEDLGRINKGLTQIYSLLKIDDEALTNHLEVNRIDYCTFGNSKPFRIRIINKLNDNYDYFYIKSADASRVYGLELEHTLSPNRINYLVDGQSLIEEHIAGIPGDRFIKENLNVSHYEKVRIAKEFVKFNERCFLRLLGDMRSYNYVIDITPDFEAIQYRVRAIDFDQQSYEGKKTIYLPQFFKENYPLVELCTELLTSQTFKQYQQEERALMGRRLRSGRYRIKDLVDCLTKNTISSPEKISQLQQELAKHHENAKFLKCNNMGEILRLHLKQLLKKHIKLPVKT